MFHFKMYIIQLVLLFLTIESYGLQLEASTLADYRINSIISDTRQGKTINLFRNVLSRPKVSPLYLLDGTVCRFVNYQPVCTTLSTTGVMRGGASGGGQRTGGGGSGGGSSGGGSSGGNRGGSSSGGGGGGAGSGGGSGGGGSGGQRPSSSGVMASGSSVQFVSPQNQLVARPAALMDDDPQDLTVDGSSNLTETSTINRDQQPGMATATASRPPNFIISRRRPVNLLPFRRPAIMRPIQVVGRERLAPGAGRLSSLKVQ